MKPCSRRGRPRPLVRSVAGLAIVLAALAASSPNAAAQDVRLVEAPQVYVRTGYVWLNQADGVSDCPYLCNPLGGGSNAVAFAVGGRLTDRFSLSGDVTVGSILEMQQTARAGGGTNFYDTRYREILITASGRWHLSLAGRSTFEPVVGGGFSFGRVTRAVELLRIFPTGTERLPDVSAVRHDPLVLVGADVTIPVAASLALVPTTRVYWLWRSGERGGSQPPEYGLGGRIITIGIGVQWSRGTPG